MEGSAERGGTTGAKAKGAIAADAGAGRSEIDRRGFGWRKLRRAKTIIQVVSVFVGSANGNRTRISALKGPRANRCTIAPQLWKGNLTRIEKKQQLHKAMGRNQEFSSSGPSDQRAFSG